MFNKETFKYLLLICCLIIFSASFSFGQKKKNSRPSDEKTEVKTEVREGEPVYFYTFSQPKFLISKILIEHDENGMGKISFHKQKVEDDISDPLKLSTKTLEKLKSLWTKLDFLNSTEDYQSKKRDYAHLGTVSLKMKKDSKNRTAEFNWSENADAKALADEYRKIGTQFIWMFNMNVARVNQPLETPRIMKGLDSYLKRDSISDPQQMLPFLKELKIDERVPLITRNQANVLIKRIEKMAKKKEEKSEK